MVFAQRRSRIQQATVEIDDASSDFSNLWRWRYAVIKAARSSTVIATRCSLMRPRTQIRYMVGCTYRALDIPHQHLPTWDEWSSPGELIHPGDWPSISSNTSSATNAVYRWGTRNGIRVVGRDLAACLWRRRHGANRGAVSRSPHCRKGLRAQHHIHLWLPGACGSKCRGMPRGVMRSRSRLSWGRWWPVTFPGRVPHPTRCRRCLAGYGQSRRAPGRPFRSSCAG